MNECKVCGQQVGDATGVCDRCDDFTNKTNRSFGQTKLLLQLVGGSFQKLDELERKIKNLFVFYCPSDKESVNEIMNTV